MGSPPHIQAIMDKYLVTPKSENTDNELENLIKKRKANTPLSMDTSVDSDNSETYELNPLDTDQHGSIKTLITHLFSKSMSDIKEMISADKKDSNKLLKSVEQKVSGIETKIDDIHSSLRSQASTIDQLVDENKQLHVRNEVTNGRLTRVEKVVDDLREELLQVNARSMKDNLVFQGIQENERLSCKDLLFGFFRRDLIINSDDMKRVLIQNCHRLGAKGSHNRDIVVKVDDETKSIIWRHVKNLKGKKYNIFPQLPRELVTRKQQLMPVFKAAREKKANVKWLGEKLLLDKQIVEAPRDKIRDAKCDPMDAATEICVKRASITTYENSSFQGSMVDLRSFDDVTSALHAIYREPNVARATHNIYAYRLSSGAGVVISTMTENTAPVDASCR